MSRTSQFLTGLQKLGEGLSFLAVHRRLWIWVAIPIGIGFICLFAGWSLFLHYFDDISYFLFQKLGAEALNAGRTWWQIWLLKPVGWIVKIIFDLIVFVVGVLAASLLSLFVYFIVAAPFLDILAEKTTFLYKGETPPDFSWKEVFRNIFRTVLIELRKFIFFFGIPIALWILNIIPLIGTVFYIGFTYLFEMWALAFGTIDYPMSHKMLPFAERFRFAWKFKYALFGFGIPFLIPFAPLIFQAPMVVGGTILYHDLSKQQ